MVNITVMLDQILLGTVIMLVSVMFGALMWWALTRVLHALEDWVNRPPLSIKLIALLGIVVAWTMMIMVFGVWLWALVYVQIEAFKDLEEAVYFSLVAYTTLGLGDVIVPFEWRLLGGMTGANGFLIFGMLTAMLTDSIREIKIMRRMEN